MKTLDYAHQYLDAGFSILPLLPRSKVPAIGSWRQYQSAPPRKWEVELWHETIPDMNIGIITGEVSGIFVVDYDDRTHCPETEPYFLRVQTGRGFHYYLQYPDFRVGNRAGIRPGVDIRGDGGYVVAPPSIHPDGGVYRWERDFDLDQITPAPQRVLDALKPKRTLTPTLRPSAGARYWAQIALENEAHKVANAPDKQRNNTLNGAAYNLGQLVGDGLLDRSVVESALRMSAASRGIPEIEGEKTIKSGIEAGIKNPRSLRAKR